MRRQRATRPILSLAAGLAAFASASPVGHARQEPSTGGATQSGGSAQGRKAQDPRPDLDFVLEQARRAAGRDAWAALDHGLTLAGEARLLGVDCGFELTLARGGAYRFETDGPLARTSGWDGEIAWSRMGAGPGRRLALEEGERERLTRWVHSGYWLDAGLALTLLPDSQGPEGPEGPEGAVVLEVAFDGSPGRARLLLDPETWLPAELVLDGGGHEVTIAFEDYRQVAGIPIAHRISRRQEGFHEWIGVASGRAAQPDPGDRFSLVRERPADTRFDEDASPEIEIQRVRTGHLLVHPLVDGEDAGWFILDTGAGQICIDPSAADALELEEFGEVPAMGVAGSVMASFRRGRSLALGPVEILDPVYVEIELSFLEPHFGVPVAGICGYDLFARATVELDLEIPSASLHDPAAYELEGGAWSELLLEDRLPTIRCSFEGDRSGFFKIDTGATGAVSFNSPAVESLGLLEGREVTAGAVGGVGGMAPVAIGEVEWFEIGGRRFEAVQAAFARSSEGVVGSTDSLGSIGSSLLHPFRVVFDYPGQRIAFLPRER